MIAIDIKNLTKNYKKKTAISSFSLDIYENELFALLGTNGAGKTTIIKILSTLIDKTSGDVKIFGMDLDKDYKKIKNIINVSPQETAIALNLSVLENLKFMALCYNINNKEEKINELIEMFKLQDVLYQKSSTLSGGYKRKLSIALSLINDPKILFLDEPTLGLDVIAKRQLWDVINDLKSKMTIILTTHYMEEAEALSDRIGIMKNGKLITVGTSSSLIKKSGAKNFEDAFVKFIEKGEVI